MNDNKIKSIAIGAFKKNAKLDTIDLNKNPLECLSQKHFDEMDNLAVLVVEPVVCTKRVSANFIADCLKKFNCDRSHSEKVPKTTEPSGVEESSENIDTSTESAGLPRSKNEEPTTTESMKTEDSAKSDVKFDENQINSKKNVVLTKLIIVLILIIEFSIRGSCLIAYYFIR